MNRLIAVGLCLGLFLGGACGGDDEQNYIATNGSGGTKSNTKGGSTSGPEGGESASEGGRSASDGGGGGAGGALVDDADGPLVTITSPRAASDPDADPILKESDVTVLCEVRPNPTSGSGVEPSSVQLQLLDGDGKAVGDAKSAAPTSVLDEYAAKFVLTELPNGAVGFRCSAKDRAEPQRQASNAVRTFVDQGPAIEASAPIALSNHRVVGTMPLRFKVEAAPVSDDDDGAGIGGDCKVAGADGEVPCVFARVAGVDIAVTESEDELGTFLGDVDFADTRLFPKTPTGSVNVELSAKNERGVTRGKSYQIVVDGSGPEITFTSPINQAMVGGNVVLTFTIEDDGAGVDDKTVLLTLNKTQEHPFDLDDNWSRMGDTYTFKFDSRSAVGAKVQITVNVDASDAVGNKTPQPATLTLNIDNEPPLLDLDPANIRLFNTQTGDCSGSFDPLGSRALGDGDGSPAGVRAAGRIGFFRALVWERTNVDPSSTIIYYAGADQSSVRLFAQHDPAQAEVPLLVDTDGDGVCDEIGEIEKIESLLAVDLKPIAGAGTALLDDTDGATAPIIPNYCTAKPTQPVLRLCGEHSDMIKVIKHPSDEPAVYGVAVSTSGAACTGSDWEYMSASAQDGWVCLAARAIDKVGNIGVSRPLRVCADAADLTGAPACSTMSLPMPSCTDGCTVRERSGNFVYDERTDPIAGK